MDDEDLERVMRAYLDLCSNENVSVKTLVLNPQTFGNEVAAYAFLRRTAPLELEKSTRKWDTPPRLWEWEGPQVNGVPAMDSERLTRAREYWTYRAVERKFRAVAAIYVLKLEAGDQVACTWHGERREWTWDGAALVP